MVFLVLLPKVFPCLASQSVLTPLVLEALGNRAEGEGTRPGRQRKEGSLHTFCLSLSVLGRSSDLSSLSAFTLCDLSQSQV